MVSGVMSLPLASVMLGDGAGFRKPPLPISTAMYEVSCFKGLVGMIAKVRPVVSEGANATTNSCGDCNSRTTLVTPPPGPVKVTSNTRTVPLWPPVMEEASGGSANVVLHGATSLKPSSAFRATAGSPKFAGLATGMFRVRSFVPDSSRLVGNGTTAFAGSKRAVMTAVTGVPPLLVAGGVATARELLLPPPQADNSNDDDSARSKLSRACMGEFLLVIRERNDDRIIGSSNGRWQREFNDGRRFVVAALQQDCSGQRHAEVYLYKILFIYFFANQLDNTSRAMKTTGA